MSWLITGAEKTPVDPLFNNVSLLLHGDGANGSTTILDSSPTPKTVTAVGNAQISTAQSKFGGSSLYFDGNSDIASVAVATTDRFGTYDFTLECWLHAITPTSSFILLDCRNVDSDNNGFAFYVRSTQKLTFGRGNPFVATEGTTTVLANTWYHAALTRQSGTVRGFLNGNLEFSVADNKDFNRSPWSIGSQYYLSAGLSAGYIDDLRITKGIARYTSNFTPPTAPFPDI